MESYCQSVGGYPFLYADTFMTRDEFEKMFDLSRKQQGINKRSEFGLRTGTKDFKTVFYKGTFRAETGTIE